MYAGRVIQQHERRMALQEAAQWLIETVITVVVFVTITEVALKMW